LSNDSGAAAVQTEAGSKYNVLLFIDVDVDFASRVLIGLNGEFSASTKGNNY